MQVVIALLRDRFESLVLWTKIGLDFWLVPQHTKAGRNEVSKKKRLEI
jgi:hypothetical protein